MIFINILKQRKLLFLHTMSFKRKTDRLLFHDTGSSLSKSSERFKEKRLSIYIHYDNKHFNLSLSKSLIFCTSFSCYHQLLSHWIIQILLNQTQTNDEAIRRQ